MTVSIAAGKVQILVGDDNQDWSEAYVSLSLNDPEIDDRGFLPISGRLTLAVLASPPDSQDPLSSAGKLRWKKGQRIIINYQKTDGSWARHPRGWLYIAKAPAPPQIGARATLEISVVCALQLQTFPVPRGQGWQFQPQFSGEQNQTLRPSNSVSRTDAIAALLPRAGLQSMAWVGQVPKFPLAVSAPAGGEAIPELMGKLAYGGLAVLQQNNQGQLTAYSAALTRSAPLLALDESQLVSIEFLEGGEAPCEQVFFNASLSYTVQLFTNSTNTSTNYGDGSAVNPALLGKTITIRQTSTSERVDSNSKIITEEIRAPFGLISPVAYPKDTSLGTDSQKVSTWYYGGEGGKLTRFTISETGLFAKFCAQYLGTLTKTQREAIASTPVTRLTSTTYDYDGDTVKQIVTQIDEPIAAVVTDEKHDSPTATKTSYYQSINYQKRGETEWTRTQVTLVPAARRGLQLTDKLKANRIAMKGALIVDPDNTSTETSNSGQTNPPAAERLPAQTEERSAPLEGGCTFVVAPNPFSPRERRFTLEVGVTGSDQLTELSQVTGGRILGRSQGIRIQIPLLDALIDNPAPLQNFSLTRTEILPTGKRRNIYLYQMDAIGYEHEADQAVATLSGIWLGTIEGDIVPHTQTPTAPTFTSTKVQAIYDSITLANSDNTSSQIVIVPPPLINFPIARGCGLGRAIISPPSFDSAPLIVERGFGFGRSLGLLSQLQARGFGVGRQIFALSDRPTTNLPISVPRGVGFGRESSPVPVIRIIERGFGIGRTASQFGLQEFFYSGTPLDTAGILYFLGATTGTNYTPTTWNNPHNMGRVVVAASTVASGAAANLVNRSTDTANRTTAVASSWYRIDFGTGRAVRPTTYLLQHDGTTGAFLRTWRLEGSNDTTTWTTLDTRTNDTTLNDINTWGAFTCNAGDTGFWRYLRVLQTGTNSDATNVLTLAEFEVYGQFDY